VRDGDIAAPGLSREMAVRGTPLYMAPESITRPNEIDARVDVYAVGAVAYFLLAGRPPFEGETAMEVMARQVRDAPEPPSRRAGRAVPERLEALVLACLEKQPGRRPATMDEVAAALAAIELDPWTDAMAADWWRERAGAVRAARSRGDTPASPPPTVAIDLARRRAEGLESTQMARRDTV
jgi:serine/threonine protein kinase